MIQNPILWLYGVIPADQRSPAGLELPIEIVRHRSVAAVVERVPAAEFAPDVLEARMRSLDWLGSLARRHQAVLDAHMREGVIVPARLCTLFSGPDAIGRALARGEARFSAAFRRVVGCAEWGVKILYDEPRLLAALAAREPRDDDAGVSEGMRYVRARQREARLRERVGERVDEVVDEALATFEAIAVEAAERPPLEAAGSTSALAARLALLLPRGGDSVLRDAVDALVQRFEPDGFRFEVSGPWAPFAFCDAGDDDEPAAEMCA